MNILTTEQLIEIIDAGAINASDIMRAKGIMNVSDWSHASPVTLGQLIKSLLGKIPETYWLVSVPDHPGDYINKNILHFDSEAYEDIEAGCREPQEMKPFETDATVAPEAELAAVDTDEEPAPAAVVPDEEPAPAAVAADEEPPSSTLEGFEPMVVVLKKKPEAAAPEKEPKRQRSDADFSPAYGLGEWAKYKERALSTSEQNDIIKGMLDDGYSVAVISTVTRLSQATVYNRIKKLGIVLTTRGGWNKWLKSIA